MVSYIQITSLFLNIRHTTGGVLILYIIGYRYAVCHTFFVVVIKAGCGVTIQRDVVCIFSYHLVGYIKNIAVFNNDVMFDGVAVVCFALCGVFVDVDVFCGARTPRVVCTVAFFAPYFHCQISFSFGIIYI